MNRTPHRPLPGVIRVEVILISCFPSEDPSTTHMPTTVYESTPGAGRGQAISTEDVSLRVFMNHGTFEGFGKYRYRLSCGTYSGLTCYFSHAVGPGTN